MTGGPGSQNIASLQRASFDGPRVDDPAQPNHGRRGFDGLNQYASQLGNNFR